MNDKPTMDPVELKRFLGMIESYNMDIHIHEHGHCGSGCWLCMELA